jgi:TATA-box binding protein (TBP) (component of TFIID and TFIIIB)
MEPVTRNVKVSFSLILQDYIPQLKKQAIKITSSYIILKRRYTFTVYFKSNLVNITGIPSFEHIFPAVSYFCRLAPINFQGKTRIAIDNSTSNGHFPFKIDFKLLSKCLANQTSIRYNPSLFPGAFLALPNGKKTILFKSGKYIIVGCKSKKQIFNSFDLLRTLLFNHNELRASVLR